MISRKRLAFAVAATIAAAQPLAAEETPTPVPAIVHRDGAHDFDSEFGRWTIHTRRLMHPLAGANDWVSYDGTKVVTPIWGGKANIAEVKEDGAAGHLQFIALRLNDPAARQWNLNFASAGVGTFSAPLYGERRDGGNDFIGPDTINGRSILVRFITRAKDADHASSKQYFSDDGGRSWELNWINNYTRAKG
ncbi:MAG: hypothetical protein HY243_00795 [Proteobacteria bacterium]|nr:hypothetical protein [Pseudomonadota bacterium]